MDKFPEPNRESVIFEDDKVYVCLAEQAIAKGHTIVAAKEDFVDLNKMPDIYYDYLMDIVFAAREALIKTLGVKKVYLVYMDETEHVHWHLIPRYKEEGFAVFQKKAETLKDFFLAKDIKNNFIFK